MLAAGALDTENPAERRRRGLTANPDGDVDVPGAPYTTFRYPACPTCLEKGPSGGDAAAVVRVDRDGAWQQEGEKEERGGSVAAGVLKPDVVMFGESIPVRRKEEADAAVDAAGRLLVVGSSLATYSAWRLAKRASERGVPVGILNVGGVRSEDVFFANVPEGNTGAHAVRCSERADVVLPQVVRVLEDMRK